MRPLYKAKISWATLTLMKKGKQKKAFITGKVKIGCASSPLSQARSNGLNREEQKILNIVFQKNFLIP